MINPKGFEFQKDLKENSEKKFFYKNETDWQYTENLGWSDYLYIVGGGHCSLSLSRVMRDLDFFVHVIDERQNLNTMEQNLFANKLQTIDSFEDIEACISSVKKIYLVVMTVGYRSDALVLKKLLHKNFFYAGLLGSEAKVKKLKSELIEGGIESSKLKALNAPIGIPINSRSPEEIAISIAAQIIAKKNAQLN
jgi:xanthine dehydrogenase accessory factor